MIASGRPTPLRGQSPDAGEAELSCGFERLARQTSPAQTRPAQTSRERGTIGQVSQASTNGRSFSPRTGLTYVGGFFAGGLGLSVIYAATGLGVSCPFRAVTGWECPLCGGTRMGSALLHGEVGAAVGFNPLALLLVGVIGALGVLWGVEAFGGPAVRASGRPSSAAPRGVPGPVAPRRLDRGRVLHRGPQPRLSEPRFDAQVTCGPGLSPRPAHAPASTRREKCQTSCGEWRSDVAFLHLVVTPVCFLHR